MMTLLVLTALLGCGDNFATVQDADTIESYESYLEANPEGTFVFQAENRLEELYLQKAKDDASLESYDAYLNRFPKGTQRSRALKDREQYLFQWAQHENSPESWTRFLKEYPSPSRKHLVKAKRAQKVAEYLPFLSLAETTHKQINLAEDPEGPLNGREFTVDVTNTGTKTIRGLWLTIEYLDTNGRPLDSREWPVVEAIWPTPVREERKVPMAPNETRDWVWSTKELPDTWSKETRVFPSRIEFAE